jgi:hypothetical protein
MSLRLSFSILASVFLANTALAADPDCSSCNDPKQPRYIYQFCKSCKNNYRAPYVHPDTPFGYYPSCWREWPGGGTCPRPGCTGSATPIAPIIDVPPIRQKTPDIEILPPPRPADPTHQSPADSQINPAVHRLRK